LGEWKSCKLGDVIKSANTGLDAIKRAPIVEKDTGIKSKNTRCFAKEIV